jgi:myo-inositol-1(or 4)-monophosphatase
MTELEVLEQAARAAGAAVRAATPTEGVVTKEGRANYVTAADLASEKAIMDAIRAAFPDDAILSEETTSDLVDPLVVARLWVIDPIDGTSNFRFGRNYSVISIGFVERGVIRAAAVYDPFHDELFMAEQGRGATVNGKPLHVGDQSQLADASVATDNSYDPEQTKRNLELLASLTPTPWVIIKGSAVLSMCDVAAGRIDLYFHTVLKPWDNAAAFLIAQEAGAKVVGLNGKPVTFMSPKVVMGNKQLVDQFLAATKPR